MTACSADYCYSNLWQFKCETCPGKYARHTYKVWIGKVKGDCPRSPCNSCNEMKEAIPRREEEGVLICFFICSCENKYTVRCEMQDTAPCYKCGEKKVKPCHFIRRMNIVSKSDNTHNCSKCNGNGDCPNMKRGVHL